MTLQNYETDKKLPQSHGWTYKKINKKLKTSVFSRRIKDNGIKKGNHEALYNSKFYFFYSRRNEKKILE